MDAYSATLSAFINGPLAAVILFVLFVLIVGGVWLGRIITRADQKRDEYNAKRDEHNAKRDANNTSLVKSQIEIMRGQQTEFARLNNVVIEALKEKNELLAETVKANRALAIVINNLGKSIVNGQTDSGLRFNEVTEQLKIILDNLQADKQYTLLMVDIISKLAKNVADLNEGELQCCTEWKEALNKRLESIESRMEVIMEGIKNEKISSNAVPLSNAI